MRLVRVKVPKGRAEAVAELAFAAGIEEVTISQVHTLNSDQRETVNDVVEIETSTPKAKAFIDALSATPFLDREECSIAVRQPRSVISREKIKTITWPLVEPTVDIFEELWQFSHVTYGFVGRILIGAMLLAYGIVEYKLLFMIAGLLFIPLLPLMLAISFGLSTRQWRLAAQGLLSIVAATILLIGGGVLVAFMSSPPVRYTESNSVLAGFLISFAVGVAAALATADDAGRRELIGLAATAQLAILPVWFGVWFVFGFPAFDGLRPPKWALSFVVNMGAILIASTITYALVGMKSATLVSFSRKS